MREFGTEVPKLDIVINNILKITRKVLLLRDNASTDNKVVQKSIPNPPSSTITKDAVAINQCNCKAQLEQDLIHFSDTDEIE